MAEKTAIIQCPVCNTRHLPRDAQKTTGVFAANCENCGHFFKYRSVPPFKTSVSFTVNGVAYSAGNEFTPATSLADFLREKRVSMGTKIMCKQGGCGICIVEAKMQLNPGQPKVPANLNACLCPLFVCDGWDITTIEGLGSTRTGMHAIQTNLADFNGTQCGYCSPGHVMNMYGLTQKYPNMTKQFVEDHFEGNLCRCTGYRPILDAFKAMVPATETDIEDLSAKMCVNNPNKVCDSNGKCGGTCHSTGATTPVRMVFDSIQWYKAVDYADLLRMMQQFTGKKIRLMGANTGTGAFYMTENVHNFEVVIDISGVPEFHVNTYDASTHSFTLGANVTLSEMIELFTKEAAKAGNTGGFNELKKYLYRVASSPIRNRATWSGNLMLKNHTKTFPSDIFNIMTVLKASLYVGQRPQDVLTPNAFFASDMTGKVLSKATFSDIPATDFMACFKVMPRSQNSLALVNGAFRCTVDPQNYTVSGQPILSIGGISGTFHRATRTEAYLVGKQLSSQQTLAGAMNMMATEVIPNSDITLPSPAYRKLVACALVYKYFLHVLGNNAGVRYRSGSTVLHDIRALSSGTQSYDTKKVDWPVDQPLKKVEANIQCTGEAEYTDDIAPLPNQLYAAFVKSTQANATIQSIDTSAIAGMTGVFKVLTAADVPSGGKNDINGPSLFGFPLATEEAIASSKISWYGQPVAVVLADSQDIADQAAFMVKVTYSNIQTPIVTIDDAIQKKSFFNLPQMPKIDVGNADPMTGITFTFFGPLKKISNHVETLKMTDRQIKIEKLGKCSIAVPTDEGLELTTTTQWTAAVQQAVAQLCGIKKNNVTVKVKRLGGGYGGKITRNNIPAAVCGLAAFITNRPVRMRMALWDNMDMVGKRINWKADYQVGHDASGKLNGVNVTFYSELGYLVNEVNIPIIYGWMDNGYYCANWKAKGVAVKTNKPIHTACRAPGSLPAVFIMEHMMEHVARTLNKDPLAVKTLNLYKQGQVTPTKMTLNHCNLEDCLNELLSSAQVVLRQKILDNFNRDNRWKKKALAVVPLKWGADVAFTKYTVNVNIHGVDGTVLVHHGGVEMGQGINTKVAQVCAYELDIPVSMVKVKSTDTINEVNNMPTGGSVTSETCCQGVITCCTNIKARMAPVKAKMSNPSWKDLVNRCLLERVALTEKVVAMPTQKPPFEYNIYGATCAEVELDVLTGEYQVNRVDIVHDCGESLNPAVDIGQIEGGFIMGMGYSTCEDVKYDPTTGRILTDDTWTYHPPTNKDIPIDFRISLLKNAPNPVGVLRSKGRHNPGFLMRSLQGLFRGFSPRQRPATLVTHITSGEPPLCMSCSVFFALRKCIEEARKEAGTTGYFDFNPPATVEKVQTACLVNPAQFRLQ